MYRAGTAHKKEAIVLPNIVIFAGVFNKFVLEHMGKEGIHYEPSE